MRSGFHERRRGGVATFGVALCAAALLWPASGAQAAKLKVLYSFCAQASCADGQAPSAHAPLVMDLAGNLYGTTAGGGDASDGVAFKLSPGKKKRWKYERLHSFCSEPSCADGAIPIGNLIVDVNGNVFGITRYGGPGAGAVFELSPPAKAKNWTFTTVYNFCSASNCADGNQPFSGLTYQGAASGLPYDGTSPLYGTATAGGAQGDGVVYQLMPQGSTWQETVLYSFCALTNCADGDRPEVGPILDASGNLYGATFAGGTGGRGVLFELIPSGKKWSEIVLHNYCVESGCSDGDTTNKLVMDGRGNIFGTTVSGGLSTALSGLVYETVPNGTNSQYSVLYEFCSQSDCADGATPKSELVVAPSGALFGTTFNGGGHDIDIDKQGGGTVFKLKGGTLKTLHRFCAKSNCADGMYPYAGLIANSSGVLFGMTEVGGAHDGGEVFQLTP